MQKYQKNIVIFLLTQVKRLQKTLENLINKVKEKVYQKTKIN